MNFIEKHKHFIKLIRTQIKMFERSGLEIHLDNATNSFKELKVLHDELKKSGQNPIELLQNDNNLRIELDKHCENVVKLKDETTETLTIGVKRDGKVTWKKEA